MKFFIYNYSIISLLSFFLSNSLFYVLLLKFHETLASLLSLIVVLNINLFFFFKLKIFKVSKKNYLKIIVISISSRVFEYLLFNFLYLNIFMDIKSNYIFAFTLIISFLVKSILFYKSSDTKKK